VGTIARTVSTYRAILALSTELIKRLQTGKVTTVDQVDDFVFRQIDAVVEVTAPEQIVVVPHLSALRTTVAAA